MANRFSLLPGRKNANKNTPNCQNSKKWPLQNLFLQLRGSDYGLLKKCQNENMQCFIANRFSLLPGRKKRKKLPKAAKIQKIAPDLLLGAIYV